MRQFRHGPAPFDETPRYSRVFPYCPPVSWWTAALRIPIIRLQEIQGALLPPGGCIKKPGQTTDGLRLSSETGFSEGTRLSLSSAQEPWKGWIDRHSRPLHRRDRRREMPELSPWHRRVADLDVSIFANGRAMLREGRHIFPPFSQ